MFILILLKQTRWTRNFLSVTNIWRSAYVPKLFLYFFSVYLSSLLFLCSFFHFENSKSTERNVNSRNLSTMLPDVWSVFDTSKSTFYNFDMLIENKCVALFLVDFPAAIVSSETIRVKLPDISASRISNLGSPKFRSDNPIPHQVVKV